LILEILETQPVENSFFSLTERKEAKKEVWSSFRGLNSLRRGEMDFSQCYHSFAPGMNPDRQTEWNITVTAIKRGKFSESVPVHQDGTFEQESDTGKPPNPAMLY